MPILTYLASSLATKFTGLNMKITNGKYIDNPTDAAAQFKIDKKPLFETVLDFYYTRID